MNSTTYIIIGVIAGIIGLLYLLKRLGLLPIFSKIFAVLVFLALLGGAGYCGVDLYRTLTAESIEIGSVETDKKETVIADFDFGTDYTFVATTETLTRNISAVKFDGTDENNRYAVYLNDHPCDTVYLKAGLIRATTAILFDNMDGSNGGETSFMIDIEFASLASKIRIQATSSNPTTVSYLNQYAYNNGLKFTVRQIISKSGLTGETE